MPSNPHGTRNWMPYAHGAANAKATRRPGYFYCRQCQKRLAENRWEQEWLCQACIDAEKQPSAEARNLRRASIRPIR